MIENLNSERNARHKIDEEAEYEGDSEEHDEIGQFEKSEFARKVTNDDDSD